MCEGEKRAPALIKRISAVGIIHAAQVAVTGKPGGKKSSRWITAVVLGSRRAAKGDPGTFDTPASHFLP